MGYGDTGAKEKNKSKAALDEAKKDKEKEDKTWAETEKGTNAKNARKDAKNETADEKERRRQEVKELEAAEEEANKKLKGSAKKGSAKVTQAEIAKNLAAMYTTDTKKKAKKKTETVAQPKLEPNLNHDVDVVEASGIDAAIAALEGEVEGQKKDKKYTFKMFEAENEERIKLENKGLKRTQLQEIIWKQWERSPDNPKKSKRCIKRKKRVI